MTGSTAALSFAFTRPARSGMRVLHAWRRACPQLQDGAAQSSLGGSPAVVRTPDIGSAWTTEEQQFLRALREAGL